MAPLLPTAMSSESESTGPHTPLAGEEITELSAAYSASSMASSTNFDPSVAESSLYFDQDSELFTEPRTWYGMVEKTLFGNIMDVNQDDASDVFSMEDDRSMMDESRGSSLWQQQSEPSCRMPPPPDLINQEDHLTRVRRRIPETMPNRYSSTSASRRYNRPLSSTSSHRQSPYLSFANRQTTEMMPVKEESVSESASRASSPSSSGRHPHNHQRQQQTRHSEPSSSARPIRSRQSQIVPCTSRPDDSTRTGLPRRNHRSTRQETGRYAYLDKSIISEDLSSQSADSYAFLLSPSGYKPVPRDYEAAKGMRRWKNDRSDKGNNKRQHNVRNNSRRSSDKDTKRRKEVLYERMQDLTKKDMANRRFFSDTSSTSGNAMDTRSFSREIKTSTASTTSHLHCQVPTEGVEQRGMESEEENEIVFDTAQEETHTSGNIFEDGSVWNVQERDHAVSPRDDASAFEDKSDKPAGGFMARVYCTQQSNDVLIEESWSADSIIEKSDPDSEESVRISEKATAINPAEEVSGYQFAYCNEYAAFDAEKLRAIAHSESLDGARRRNQCKMSFFDSPDLTEDCQYLAAGDCLQSTVPAAEKAKSTETEIIKDATVNMELDSTQSVSNTAVQPTTHADRDELLLPEDGNLSKAFDFATPLHDETNPPEKETGNRFGWKGKRKQKDRNGSTGREAEEPSFIKNRLNPVKRAIQAFSRTSYSHKCRANDNCAIQKPSAKKKFATKVSVCSRSDSSSTEGSCVTIVRHNESPSDAVTPLETNAKPLVSVLRNTGVQNATESSSVATSTDDKSSVKSRKSQRRVQFSQIVEQAIIKDLFKQETSSTCSSPNRQQKDFDASNPAEDCAQVDAQKSEPACLPKLSQESQMLFSDLVAKYENREPSVSTQCLIGNAEDSSNATEKDEMKSTSCKEISVTPGEKLRKSCVDMSTIRRRGRSPYKQFEKKNNENDEFNKPSPRQHPVYHRSQGLWNGNGSVSSDSTPCTDKGEKKSRQRLKNLFRRPKSKDAEGFVKIDSHDESEKAEDVSIQNGGNSARRVLRFGSLRSRKKVNVISEPSDVPSNTLAINELYESIEITPIQCEPEKGISKLIPKFNRRRGKKKPSHNLPTLYARRHMEQRQRVNSETSEDTTFPEQNTFEDAGLHQAEVDVVSMAQSSQDLSKDEQSTLPPFRIMETDSSSQRRAHVKDDQSTLQSPRTRETESISQLTESTGDKKSTFPHMRIIEAKGSPKKKPANLSTVLVSDAESTLLSTPTQARSADVKSRPSESHTEVLVIEVERPSQRLPLLEKRVSPGNAKAKQVRAGPYTPSLLRNTEIMIVEAEPQKSSPKPRDDSVGQKLSTKKLPESSKPDENVLASSQRSQTDNLHVDERQMQRSTRSLPVERPALRAKEMTGNRSEELPSARPHVEVSTRKPQDTPRTKKGGIMKEEIVEAGPARKSKSKKGRKTRSKPRMDHSDGDRYPAIETKDSGIMKMRSYESEDEMTRLRRFEKELSKQLMDDILLIARLEEQERLFGSNTKADKKRSTLIKSLVTRVEETMKETARLKKLLRSSRRSNESSSRGSSKLLKLYSEVMSCHLSHCSAVKAV